MALSRRDFAFWSDGLRGLVGQPFENPETEADIDLLTDTTLRVALIDLSGGADGACTCWCCLVAWRMSWLLVDDGNGFQISLGDFFFSFPLPRFSAKCAAAGARPSTDGRRRQL